MSYVWIPAGAVPINVYLYVRYQKTNSSRIDATYNKEKRISWIKTPDRELFICHNQEHRPLDENYDECLNLSFYDDDGIGNKELKYALMSAQNVIQRNITNRKFYSNNCKVKLFFDSGGAQLKVGSSNYIDPYKIINVYNNIADIGASLDVPPRLCDHTSSNIITKVIKASMYVQKKNNKIFLEERRKNLKLLNVAHGFTHDQVKAWCDFVEDDNFYGWAAGADNLYSHTSCLQNIIIPFKHNRGDFFHLFGISGRSMIPVLAWMGKYIPNLSTDSTSYYQAILSRKMWIHDHTGNLQLIPVGIKNRKFGPMLTIPCSCMVCSTIKYLDIYSLDLNYNTVDLLLVHNLLVTIDFTRTWDLLAQSYDFVEYCNFVRQSFSNGDYLVTLIEYVDEALRDSPKKASQNYSSLFSDDPTSVRNSEFPDSYWSDYKHSKVKNNKVNTVFSLDSAVKDTLPNYLTKEEQEEYL